MVEIAIQLLVQAVYIDTCNSLILLRNLDLMQEYIT